MLVSTLRAMLFNVEGPRKTLCMVGCLSGAPGRVATEWMAMGMDQSSAVTNSADLMAHVQWMQKSYSFYSDPVLD